VAKGTGNRQTLAADGSTAAKSFVGPVMYSVSGSFAATPGTITLQASDPSGVLVDITATALSVVGEFFVDFPVNSSNSLVATLAGATGTTALVIWIQGKQLGSS